MATHLITGIAGFIGSALARAVLAQGDKVRGIDNFSTGRRENLTEILHQIDFRQADLLDHAALQDACRGVDFVFHEAALPSVPKSVLDPVASNRVNVDGTLNLLVAARDAKVKRVVYAASSSAYGDTPTLPKREEMTTNPISPYAVAKLAGIPNPNTVRDIEYGRDAQLSNVKAVAQALGLRLELVEQTSA